MSQLRQRAGLPSLHLFVLFRPSMDNLSVCLSISLNISPFGSVSLETRDWYRIPHLTPPGFEMDTSSRRKHIGFIH